MTDKSKIRQEILSQRSGLSAGEVSFRSKKIFDQFNKKFPELNKSSIKKVALYFPTKNEVDTRDFLVFFKLKAIETYFPKVIDDKLEFYRVDDVIELSLGAFGIAEPSILKESRHSKDFDLVIVPGVAFSKNCDRIGYGKGYYDMFLRNLKTISIGVAYDFQIQDTIPCESHDIKLTYILSESATYSSD